MIYHPYNFASHYNRLGYYQVGEHLTYSKIEAMDLAARGLSPIWFRFNDEKFSLFDWSKEPEMSLESLYRLRAQQIREQYDYVVVMYSGGADSHNVLMSFVNAGLHIDEIAHVTEYQVDQNRDSFANAEIFKVAYPTAKNIISQRNLKTKQRVIDVSQIVLDLGDLMDADEYRSGTSSWMTPGNMAKSYIRERVPEYQQLAEQGKKICFVWGIDKPGLVTLVPKKRLFRNICYAVVFHDREGSLISPRQKYLNRSWEHDEYFYWSADLPELICKQAHVIRKAVTAHTVTGLQSSFKEFGFRLGQGSKFLPLDLDSGHRAIYPYWDTDTFSSGKTVSRVYSDRDAWLFSGIESTKTVKMFQSVVTNLQGHTYWKNNKDGLPVTYSRIYLLDKIDNIENYHVHYPLDRNVFAEQGYF